MHANILFCVGKYARFLSCHLQNLSYLLIYLILGVFSKIVLDVMPSGETGVNRILLLNVILSSFLSTLPWRPFECQFCSPISTLGPSVPPTRRFLGGCCHIDECGRGLAVLHFHVSDGQHVQEQEQWQDSLSWRLLYV